MAEPHVVRAQRAALDTWRRLLRDLVDVQEAAEAVLVDDASRRDLVARAVHSELPPDEPPGYVVVEFSETFERELERLADSRLESFLASECTVGPR